MATQKISLVLSGGGARGLAHIGVIEELEMRGYEITQICGTSMGAMVGGIYAAGKLPDFKLWLSKLNRYSLFRLMDISFRNKGLIKGERIMSALGKFVPDEDILDLPISFSAVASDILRRQEVLFSEGSLHEALRASTSIPTLFTPVRRDGMILVDGGVYNNLPVNHVKKKWGTRLIAVDVNSAKVEALIAVGSDNVEKSAVEMHQNQVVNASNNPSILQHEAAVNYRWLLDRTISILIEQTAHASIAKNPPDLLINIPRDIAGTLHFLKYSSIIEEGRTYAKRYLDEFEKKESEGFMARLRHRF